MIIMLVLVVLFMGAIGYIFKQQGAAKMAMYAKMCAYMKKKFPKLAPYMDDEEERSFGAGEGDAGCSD